MEVLSQIMAVQWDKEIGLNDYKDDNKWSGLIIDIYKAKRKLYI